MILQSVSFTGHRPNKLGGYDEKCNKIVDIKNALLYDIIRAYEKGYTNFISGMAIGVDTWAAEAVIRLRGGTFRHYLDLRYTF